MDSAATEGNVRSNVHEGQSMHLVIFFGMLVSIADMDHKGTQELTSLKNIERKMYRVLSEDKE